MQEPSEKLACANLLVLLGPCVFHTAPVLHMLFFSYLCFGQHPTGV